jgi:hypothetical protein
LRGRSFLAPLNIFIQGSQRSPVSLVVLLWGAVQMFKSGFGTLCGSDPDELLDIPMVT